MEEIHMTDKKEAKLVLRIKKITKQEVQKQDEEIITYKLTAKDKDGLNEMTITSAYPFKGMVAGSGIIQVTIKNSQMSLDEFKGE